MEEQKPGPAAIKIPITSSYGGMRLFSAEELRAEYRPYPAIAWLSRAKSELVWTVEQLQAQGREFNKERVRRIIELINQLMLEAAEALARFGNAWPAQSEPSPQQEEVIEKYIAERLFFEDDDIHRGLSDYADGLRAEGELELEEKLRVAIEEIDAMMKAVREKTGWKSVTFLQYRG